jgi:hypothetical protein
MSALNTVPMPRYGRRLRLPGGYAMLHYGDALLRKGIDPLTCARWQKFTGRKFLYLRCEILSCVTEQRPEL